MKTTLSLSKLWFRVGGKVKHENLISLLLDQIILAKFNSVFKEIIPIDLLNQDGRWSRD